MLSSSPVLLPGLRDLDGMSAGGREAVEEFLRQRERFASCADRLRAVIAEHDAIKQSVAELREAYQMRELHLRLQKHLLQEEAAVRAHGQPHYNDDAREGDNRFADHRSRRHDAAAEAHARPIDHQVQRYLSSLDESLEARAYASAPKLEERRPPAHERHVGAVAGGETDDDDDDDDVAPVRRWSPKHFQLRRMPPPPSSSGFVNHVTDSPTPPAAIGGASSPARRPWDTSADNSSAAAAAHSPPVSSYSAPPALKAAPVSAPHAHTSAAAVAAAHRPLPPPREQPAPAAAPLTSEWFDAAIARIYAARGAASGSAAAASSPSSSSPQRPPDTHVVESTHVAAAPPRLDDAMTDTAPARATVSSFHDPEHSTNIRSVSEGVSAILGLVGPRSNPTGEALSHHQQQQQHLPLAAQLPPTSPPPKHVRAVETTTFAVDAAEEGQRPSSKATPTGNSTPASGTSPPLMAGGGVQNDTQVWKADSGTQTPDFAHTVDGPLNGSLVDSSGAGTPLPVASLINSRRQSLLEPEEAEDDDDGVLLPGRQATSLLVQAALGTLQNISRTVSRRATPVQQQQHTPQPRSSTILVANGNDDGSAGVEVEHQQQHQQQTPGRTSRAASLVAAVAPFVPAAVAAATTAATTSPPTAAARPPAGRSSAPSPVGDEAAAQQPQEGSSLTLADARRQATLFDVLLRLRREPSVFRAWKRRHVCLVGASILLFRENAKMTDVPVEVYSVPSLKAVAPPPHSHGQKHVLWFEAGPAAPPLVLGLMCDADEIKWSRAIKSAQRVAEVKQKVEAAASRAFQLPHGFQPLQWHHTEIDAVGDAELYHRMEDATSFFEPSRLPSLAQRRAVIKGRERDALLQMYKRYGSKPPSYEARVSTFCAKHCPEREADALAALKTVDRGREYPDVLKPLLDAYNKGSEHGSAYA